jgi:peroxiredoxin
MNQMMRAAALRVMLFSAVASACASDTEEQPYRRLTEGDAVPAYAAATLGGDTLSLADLRGQAVMLNIWATWCIPCRAEMPGLQSLHEQLGEEGLRVVGVSIDAGGATESVRMFLEDFGITFTILHDPSERVTRAFRTMGVPETFLIGRDGRIVKRWIGKFDPMAESTLTAVRAALEAG